jgi:GTP-binding protein
MEIKEAEYIGSFPSIRQCPKDSKPEYAFIGRSNVGKSSLINLLCNRRDLARVSNTPGKTQTLNYYLIDKFWYIVDLPGYGYAKISKKKRHEWEKMIEGYLLHRQNLGCAFVLVDANIPPQLIDIEFVNWMGKMSIPFVIVFTKSDRLKSNDKKKNIDAFNNELLKYWNELPQQFVTSSTKRLGAEAILQFIEEVNIASE